MIMDSAKPVYSRGLNDRKALPEEIGKSLILYRADKNNKEVEDVIFMHDSSLDTKNTGVYMKEFFKIPVNFYKNNMDFKNFGSSPEIDLLPKEYIYERLSRKNAKQIFLTYFLLSVTIFMLISFFVFKIREKNKILLVFSDNTEKIQKDLNQLSIFLEKIKIIKYQKEEGEAAINILKECYKLMPRDMFLDGIDSGDKGVIYCAGRAKDINSVFDFIKILEKSKYFEKIEVKYAAKKKTGNLEFTDFSIGCYVSK
jgi:hypothetical protein